MTITTNKVLLNQQRNVSLVTMIQDVTNELNVGKRPGIVVLPGGGYSMCSDREAEVVAYPYLAAGYHAFVLRYSVGEHRHWPNPLSDWDQAMEYILEHAGEWGLDPNKIAVIGFSAGGHLAASAATMAKNRPNAAILGYAALCQDVAEACQPGMGAPSPIDHVDRRTPPCFLFAARDDEIVSMENPLEFMRKLDRFDITFECHIYPFGGHGFSTAEPQLVDSVCRRAHNWVSDSIGFLEDVFGVLTPKGLQEPVCPGKVNGNYEPTLSTECTYGYVKSCPQGVAAIAPVIETMDRVISSAYGDSALANMVFGKFKLGTILGFLNKTPEEIKEIDKLLRTVKNPRYSEV